MESIKQCEFSEKYYEFSVNLELFKHYGFVYIPSQVKEKIWGYDSMVFPLGNSIGGLTLNSKIRILLLQYKKPSLIDLSIAAKNLKNYKSLLRTPWQNNEVLRFGIYYSSSVFTETRIKKFHQHNTLVKLANLSGIKAFYCAPRFIKEVELIQNLTKKTVTSNSVFIDFDHLPLLSDGYENHNMYFDPINNRHKLYSEEYDYQDHSLNFESFIRKIENVESIEIRDMFSHLDIHYREDFVYDDSKYIFRLLSNYLDRNRIIGTNIFLIID